MVHWSGLSVGEIGRSVLGLGRARVRLCVLSEGGAVRGVIWAVSKALVG